MWKSVMTIHRIWILAVLSLVSAQTAAQEPLKIEELTEETAVGLTDSSVIIVNDEQMTLGELKRQFREQKVAYAHKLGEATKAWTAQSTAFRQQQLRHRRAIEERLSGADQIPADMAMLRLRARAATHPEINAIRKEALELKRQMRNASPEERAAIRRRAVELLKKVDQPR